MRLADELSDKLGQLEERAKRLALEVGPSYLNTGSFVPISACAVGSCILWRRRWRWHPERRLLDEEVIESSVKGTRGRRSWWRVALDDDEAEVNEHARSSRSLFSWRLSRLQAASDGGAAPAARPLVLDDVQE